MTYKESKKEIDANRDNAQRISLAQKPSADISGFFVGPMQIFSDQNLRDYFIESCIKNYISDETVLNELPGNWYYSDQLAPFVVYRQSGNYITMLLSNYLTIPLPDSEGNDS